VSVLETPRGQALATVAGTDRRLREAAAEGLRYDAFRAVHALADDHDAVMLYLTDLLDRRSLSGNALRVRLRHLDTCWGLQGRPAPSRDRTVRAFVRALHQEAALGPVIERQPLYLEHVLAIVDAIAADHVQQSLDVALLYLANATCLSTVALTQLSWGEVRFYRNRVVITVVPRGRPSGLHGKFSVTATEHPRTVEALREARHQVGPMQGPVFAHCPDVPPRRGTVQPVLERLPSRRGPWSWTKIASLPEAALADDVQYLSLPTPRQLRDTALVLLAFTAALDSGDARHLRLADVTVDERGLTLNIAARRGTTGIPPARHAHACPVQAWSAWASAYRALGFDDNSPAFPRVMPHIQPGEGLSLTSMTRVVTDRAAQARLDGTYNFTSLRMGFLRSALRQGVTDTLILKQAGLVRPHSLEVHRRREQLISHNVVALLGL
jgi:hypothetical protein